LWTWPAWHTCLGWYCNPQLLQPRFSMNLHASPLPFLQNIFAMKSFHEPVSRDFWTTGTYIRLAAIAINYHGGNSGYNSLLSRAFSVGIPLTVGFRPQLVVVSGLSVGIPLTVGFRPQLVVVSGLSVGIPLMVGFRLSWCLWLSRSLFINSSSFHNGFMAIRKPFTWFFFFFNGISAITKPFSRIFLSYDGDLG
jgi:hypothetical protein